MWPRCATIHMWKSDNNFWELVFSFHLVASGYQFMPSDLAASAFTPCAMLRGISLRGSQAVLCPSFLSPRGEACLRDIKGPCRGKDQQLRMWPGVWRGGEGFFSSWESDVCMHHPASLGGDNSPKEIGSGSSHLPLGCLRDLVTSPQGSRGKPFHVVNRRVLWDRLRCHHPFGATAYPCSPSLLHFLLS